jgi:hypothetical protein
METLRLGRAVNCDRCFNKVKPFVIETAFRDIGRGDEPFIKVQCPIDSCQAQFQVFAEGDEYESLTTTPLRRE